MSLLKKAKINKVSLDLSKYMYYIQGQHKTGKTTFARDFILERYQDPSKGLLLAIGKEKGYNALDNIQALDVETWKEFDAIVKELVETKGENGIEFVFVDTLDELLPLAEKEIMRLSQIATGKPSKTFNACFGGYGAPRIELRKLVTEKISLLNQYYGLVVLGHTKLKTIKEQGATEEQEYQILSSNLNTDYHNIVAHKADVIGTVVVEKSTEDKRLKEVETNLYFRSNGFVEAGSRFSNIVEKIEFNAHNFINAIEDAIKSTSSTKMTNEEFKVEQEKEKKINDEIAISQKEEVLSQIDGKSEEVINKDELLPQIQDKMKSADAETRNKAIAFVKSKGGKTSEMEIEDLKTLFDMFK
jgi:hypothetical protein